MDNEIVGFKLFNVRSWEWNKDVREYVELPQIKTDIAFFTRAEMHDSTPVNVHPMSEFQDLLARGFDWDLKNVYYGLKLYNRVAIHKNGREILASQGIYTLSDLIRNHDKVDFKAIKSSRQGACWFKAVQEGLTSLGSQTDVFYDHIPFNMRAIFEFPTDSYSAEERQLYRELSQDDEAVAMLGKMIAARLDHNDLSHMLEKVAEHKNRQKQIAKLKEEIAVTSEQIEEKRHLITKVETDLGDLRTKLAQKLRELEKLEG